MTMQFPFDNVAKFYTEKILTYGDSPKSLCQGKNNKADLRYASVAKHMQLNEKNISVLDVGCGFGDFFYYLQRHGWSGTYLGIDITAEAIAIAKKKYAGVTFEVGDLYSSYPDDNKSGLFDYVISISAFTLKIASASSDNYYSRCMEKMFLLSKKACIISGIMSSYVDYQKEMAWHADPAAWFERAMQLTRCVVLDHSFLPYEFSLVLRHAEIDTDNIYKD